MMLFLGVDAGGTASRAVVATPGGAVVGRGSAGPGNPTATGRQAARSIGTAIRAALGDRDPRSVRAAVIGVAGVGMLADPAVSAAFDAEWAAIGLACPMTVVGDAVAAFAAATPAASGAVLIAGTGAVAARIDNWRITRTADGLGWLLGDEGSGLWLGLGAVRATARAWASTAARQGPDHQPARDKPETAQATARTSASTDRDSAPKIIQDGLAARVAAHAGVGSRDGLVQWAGRQPPGAFAALAPLVCAAALTGDPIAERLVADAATRLVATLAELGAPDGPVVLAGGLLTADTPVRAGVLAALTRRGTVVRTAHDPATGAAWLALRRAADLDGLTADHLHTRMLRQPPDKTTP